VTNQLKHLTLLIARENFIILSQGLVGTISEYGTAGTVNQWLKVKHILL
jgi:hypothetical protein